MIGDIVTVTIDRPLGSFHPEYKDMYYPVNYGYIEGILAPDGEEQDAYVLGINKAVEKFTGKIIAVIHRSDDVEEKWGLSSIVRIEDKPDPFTYSSVSSRKC